MQPFDYATAGQAEILARAAALTGSTLGEIGARLPRVLARRDKGEIGAAIEAYFGIPRNSVSGPDFPSAAIELKTVPLVRRGSRLACKERTVLGMIDYFAIVDETWHTASIRKKLDCLFVFYEHRYDRPRERWRILSVCLWRPSKTQEAFLESDWEAVVSKVRAGRAHELSEADGAVMGPCTKGASGSTRRGQPQSNEPARPRAFALKAAFVFEQIYLPNSSARGSAASLPAKDFESQLLARASMLVGRAVGDISAELGISGEGSKSFGANVVRRSLLDGDGKGQAAQLRSLGLTLRSPRVHPDLMPYEHVSFPELNHWEFVDESWEESTFLQQFSRMLFIPLIGRTKDTLQSECKVGCAKAWSPRAEDVKVARLEWLRCQELVRKGETRLPHASETRILHIRPHGRDKSHVVETPAGAVVTKQSFWLNRQFVAAILRSES